MRIVEARVGVIGGKLRGSVGNAHQRWTERKSVLLVLRDDEGRIGLGEAAPLPGYSPDTLEQCLADLSRVIDEAKEDLERYIGPLFRLNPAANFALETANFDLIAQRRGESFGDSLVGGNSRDKVDRCGLIDGPPSTWEATWSALHERAISVFKIKVGRKDASAEELRELLALRKAHGHNWTLRLDANGAWSPEEARVRLESFAELGVEFVEQPCAPGELEHLGELAVPWAADESLRDPEEVRRLRDTPCSAFVLKPAILGSFARCRFVPSWRKTALPGVVSHLFDGPISLASSCEIARALPAPALSAGLDTHDALSAWPEMPIPQLQQPGVITPASEPGLGFTREQREEIASWIS